MAYNEVVIPLDDKLNIIRQWCTDTFGPRADCLSSMFDDRRTTICCQYPWTTAYRKKHYVLTGRKEIAFHFYNPEHAFLFKLTWA